LGSGKFVQMEEKMIAPCGMNCSLCAAYLFKENDYNKKGFNRKYCPGCIPRGKNCVHMGDSCKLLREGLLRFCFECAGFPCSRLKNLDKRYRTKYHMSMIANLRVIKNQGIDEFLEKEEVKWRCGDCGGIICCHNGLCLACDLEKLKNNKKYRWGEE